MSELESSFSTLFGPNDHAEGSEARSVLSPAAYLVDLLMLTETAGYLTRRPDVARIPLDQASTYTELPQLDIAIDVMRALVDARELTDRRFPWPLPFSEQSLRLELYAEKLGTSLDELQRLLRTVVDAHLSARLLLGLSPEEVDLFATPRDADSDDSLRLLWGLRPGELTKLQDGDVALIKKKLRLSLKELKLLVRQDLSDAELERPVGHPAERFFINQGADYIVLDDEMPRPKLRLKSGAQLTLQHLDRMMRFVRLARRLEIAFPDLDWLLQTTSREGTQSRAVKLDQDGLQAISVALGLRASSELPFDELCTLWGAVKSHGQGDGAVPADLHHRVFEDGFPVRLQASIDAIIANHGTADALDERLQGTLRVTGPDFQSLKAALRARGVAAPALVYADVLTHFTGVRRLVTLSTLLSLDVRELVALLDVLGAQWTVSEHDDLSLPAPFTPATTALNPLARLMQPDVPAREVMDVLQKTVRLKSWLDARQLSARQLAFICLADHADGRARLDDGSPIDDVQADGAVAATLEDLYQALADVLVPPAALQTGSLTGSGAEAVFDALVSARVLVSFGVPQRSLLRVEPNRDELALALQAGFQERLEVHASDLAALGFTDVALLLSLLEARGYLELIEDAVDNENRYFVAPGLAAYFGDPSGTATFTLPNFQAHAEALFLALQQQRSAVRLDPTTLTAVGVDADDLLVLFPVLAARGYVVAVPGSSPAAYRVADDQQAFFADSGNVPRFALPDFSAAFAALASKVEAYKRADANRPLEAEDLAGRLGAVGEQQTRLWLRTIAGLVGLGEDVTQIALAWAFGTPDETLLETLTNATVALFRTKQSAEAPLSDAYLASRFRRLQQLGLLLRKTSMSADEARVYLENQTLHRALPETLKVVVGFLEGNRVDALTTLPNGDFLIVSGPRYVAFDRSDYRLSSTGSLDQIPGVSLSGAFRARVLQSGIDAAFSDTAADGGRVLHLCAGDQYVTVRAGVTSAAKPLAEWGRVRNNIQDNARVDAAVQDQSGHLFLFSGDQYVRYDAPEHLLAGTTYVEERYPRSIRGKFEAEALTPLPAAMFAKVDAAFRDDDRYYFFNGHHYAHSSAPYQLVQIRQAWGRVLNYLFDECRVDAAFVLGNVTYLTRKNQLTRYTGPAYQTVDERFPVSFGNLAESEPLLRVLRRFPGGLDAALAGRDGHLYAFKDGRFASSAAPDTSLIIRDRWGRVRNVFIDNQRVDGALFYAGVLYLFCGDQYARYSTSDYEFVDEGYPKRVHANWNSVEHIGQLPSGLPLPVTAVAVGRTTTGTTDDLYFFGGTKYSGPSGALEDVKAQWARVRNNVERTGVVDAALLDGSGRLYLFSGDQFYRYSTAEQPFVDETYPRRLAGSWAQEGTGYSLPDAFTNGISAAVRGGDGRLFFFSGQTYARVDAAATVAPASNAQHWGVVRNVVQSQRRVGSAFVDASGNTYLFSGDQFVRYSTASYDFADEGYPLTIGTRWGNNLPAGFRSDIDASLLFRSPVDNVQRLYLFKGDDYVRYSTSNFAQVDAGYPKRLRDGIAAEGLWFRGFAYHELPPIPLPNDFIDAVDATYVDTFNGQPRLFVFYRHAGALQWRREYRNGNWLPPVPMNLVNDYLPFARVDATFIAADGTLHVFSGEQHATRPPAGGALTTPVSIETRWARVKNQFAELSRVDASLSMADTRTYLFCATQYIKYSGTLRPGDPDFYVEEGYPKRIAPNWPNESVAIGLVPELQPTGYDLCRDASGKIHYFNATRYNFSGNPGADQLLTSRWGKVENRFQDLNRVDGAYRADNGKLYLFCDTQFTRYSGALSPGSPEFYADEGYPRRVAAWWSAEGLSPAMPDTWSALGSAVVRDAQQTYAFSGASFTSNQTPAPTPVVPHWAKVRNEVQTQNRVDAGFVYGQGASAITLVFSADQYVRYSGASYDGFVDEGYPKVIAHLAQADGVFPSLPGELLAELRGFFAGTDGELHVFGAASADGPQRYLSSALGSTLQPLSERWGIVDNQLWDDEFVNAALRMSDGKLFLFSGDQYLRYSGADRTYVDESYPRKISTSYAAELGVPALAPALNQGIDAALIIGTTHFYFAGDQVVSSSQPALARPLTGQWGLVENRLQQTAKLDAAFVAPNGKLYLFAQNQYAVYSGTNRIHVDEEFPRVVATDIGALWPQAAGNDFTQDLSAAAAFEGRSYLFKGEAHVRISDFRLRTPDAGYPLDNAAKFVDRFDFELGELPDWWRVKQLFDDYSAQIPTLLEYLDEFRELSPGAPAPASVLSKLARATQWPADAVEALLGILALSTRALLDTRSLVRMARCFELADRVGAAPQKLETELWQHAFMAPSTPELWPGQLRAAADFLLQLVKAATSAKDWPEVSRALHDVVANATRDALVAYLVENDPPNVVNDPNVGDLQDEDDLYEHLLTDVQMDASSDTSKMVEAINSIQLFYHRALMRLESIPDQPPGTLANLKKWWPWMKNYRVWEANRKVFLHPENYIRPELRTEKSPAFEQLEEKLLQDEITAISVQEGYQHYLEAFHEIARLRIVGGYRYRYRNADDQERTAVFMVGVSRTDPPIYYYRFGELGTESQDPTKPPPLDWEPWQKVGITIQSDRVQPVYAFNRLFLFWTETKPYNATTFSAAGDEEYSAESEGAKQAKLAVKFSFYNFTKEWVAPQSLQLNPDDPSDPEVLAHIFAAEAASKVVLVAHNPFPQGGQSPTDPSRTDDIYLSLRFLFWEWKVGKLSDGLDLVRDPGQGWHFTGLSFLGDQETPFPTHLGIDPTDVTATVPWGEFVGADTGEWFSFDAKGGTFLCRRSGAPASYAENEILGKVFSEPVTAAFSASNGDVFVFTHDRTHGGPLAYSHYVRATPPDQDPWRSRVDATDPAWPWGRLATVFQLDSAKRIQNVIVSTQGDVTYFLLDSHFFTYAGGAYHVTREEFRRDFQGGAPSLDTLLGGGVSALSWQDATASDRALVRAFKLPGAQQAVVVGRHDDELGAAAVDLDQLRQLSQSGGSTPFDGWDTLDTVFQLEAPEPCVVFSRGLDLVTFTWSTRSWSTATLAPLPDGAAGLSAAFLGLDGKLYFFVDARFAEVNSLDLQAALAFAPVSPRWGQQPSLFRTRLHQVDGAVFGPDDKLYLFSGDSCLRYDNLNPSALSQLIVHDADGALLENEPPKIADVWRSADGKRAGINEVTSAFGSNGRVYLSGRGPLTFPFPFFNIDLSLGTVPVLARYSLNDRVSPFQADPGYPSPFAYGETSALPTAFYARLFVLQDRSFSITRLTSNTSEGFSRALFARGIPGLLSLATQQIRELPYFTPFAGQSPPRAAARDELFVRYHDRLGPVTDYPGEGQEVDGLDFTSANAFYYWELFFHIPFLIAQALKQEQRFEESLRWYEYVFDPTVPQSPLQYWKFLAFVDDSVREKTDLRPLEDQLKKYREDPFDPHAIAELRPLAYRKAFMMSYVDNLLLWGDMLFRQYTRESLGEATMLYVRAADILGRKPEELGKRAMSQTRTYQQLIAAPAAVEITEEILQLENGVPPVGQYDGTYPVPIDGPNDSLFNPYFYIPENEEFVGYWHRVGDRLFKIRHGLNIDGVRQTLSLFAPPVDVLALVQAFASGAGLAQALADYNLPVPHYRFAFMLGRARELTSRLTGLGGALLAALEKKDAEELSSLRNTQERGILEMQLEIKQQQLESAKQSLAALHEGLKNAQARETYYQQLLTVGLTVHEQTQLSQMIAAQALSQVGNVFGTMASIASFVPNAGSPFAMTYGGLQISPAFLGLSHAFRSLSESSSFQSSLAATLGSWERRSQDWLLQRTLARGDTLQIGRQIKAAEIQVDVANQEAQVQRRLIKNNLAIDTFMNSKFTSKQLYQWMVGKLSATYFQTYNLALSYAKAAQRGMQFELALPESDVKYVGAGYWDSLKKGLLAGEQLQLDLDRLDKAYVEANERRLEITRYVSLLQVDPLALVRLKERGRCEFELGEALFDTDFPGHYCRQIKAVSLSFPAVVGPYHNFNASLTQLGHRTLLTPDKKALNYLLGRSTEAPEPSVLRTDWRPNQQIALSTGVNDSGLFQANFQDERYLPFEGTGAVSTWRLEIDGVHGALHRRTLSDVVITLQYTARQAGSAFAETVKSAIGSKTTESAWLLNLAADYSDAWQAFMSRPADGIAFTVDHSSLPGASTKQVTSVYLHYELPNEPEDDISRLGMRLTAGAPPSQTTETLKPGSFKTGLRLPLLGRGQNPASATWRLTPTSASAAGKFAPKNIRSIGLVVIYASKPTF